jgi:hypothetical protein
LVVTKRTVGSFRCPGPPDPLTDFSVFVQVRLLTPDSCAGIWFRFTTAGYAVRVCRDGYHLVTHGAGTPTEVVTVHTFPFDAPVELDTPIRVGITAEGSDLRLYRDGQQVDTWHDTRFSSGRVALGIFQDRPQDQPPFVVSFADVEIWSLAR